MLERDLKVPCCRPGYLLSVDTSWKLSSLTLGKLLDELVYLFPEWLGEETTTDN